MHNNLRTVEFSTVASGEDYAGVLGISVSAICGHSIWNDSSCDMEPPVVVVLNGHVRVEVSHLYLLLEGDLEDAHTEIELIYKNAHDTRPGSMRTPGHGRPTNSYRGARNVASLHGCHYVISI